MSGDLDRAARLLIDAGWLVVRDDSPDRELYIDDDQSPLVEHARWCVDGWVTPYPVEWRAPKD